VPANLPTANEPDDPLVGHLMKNPLSGHIKSGYSNDPYREPTV
jgi:hypothetical protein